MCNNKASWQPLASPTHELPQKSVGATFMVARVPFTPEPPTPTRLKPLPRRHHKQPNPKNCGTRHILQASSAPVAEQREQRAVLSAVCELCKQDGNGRRSTTCRRSAVSGVNGTAF